MMRALIVDDEPPARDRLRRLVSEHPDVEVVDETGDVAAALEVLRGEQIDVVFLDIHLPGRDGFDLLNLYGPRYRPAVVCVTANAGHAVRAFDEAVVDYLLKPFSRERLADAMSRIRRHGSLAERSPALRPVRIPVPGPTGTRFVDQRQVLLIRGERNYVRLHLSDRTVLLRSTLQDMAERVSGTEFVRISRSAIVRLAAVVELRSLPHGELALRLSNGDQVISSRTYGAQIRTALGL